MYVLSYGIVYVLTRVLFWCLFPSFFRNSGNTRQNNPFMSTKTARHPSTFIILYFLYLNSDGLAMIGYLLMDPSYINESNRLILTMYYRA